MLFPVPISLFSIFILLHLGWARVIQSREDILDSPVEGEGNLAVIQNGYTVGCVDSAGTLTDEKRSPCECFTAHPEKDPSTNITVKHYITSSSGGGCGIRYTIDQSDFKLATQYFFECGEEVHQPPGLWEVEVFHFIPANYPFYNNNYTQPNVLTENSVLTVEGNRHFLTYAGNEAKMKALGISNYTLLTDPMSGSDGDYEIGWIPGCDSDVTTF